MSIAKMKKVTIIGTKDKEEEILKEIMKHGFLQIEDMSPLIDEEEYKGIFIKEEQSEEIAKINQRLLEIEKAIDHISKEEYQTLINNVRLLKEKLTNGAILLQVIKQIENT